MSVTCVIPTYNAEKYIEDALEQLLPCLGVLDRVIVQDGASTDRTLEVVRRAAHTDTRISLSSHADRGQSDALNSALARVETEYVFWMNADDLIFPSAFAKLLAQVVTTGCVVGIGGHLVVAEDGTTELSQRQGMQLAQRRLLILGCYVFSGSMVIRTRLLRDLGGFRQDLHYAMDLDLMLRISARIGLSQSILPEPVAALRWHDSSKSGSVPWKFAREASAVRAAHARGAANRASAYLGMCIHFVAIATTRIRHNVVYRRFRERLPGL